MELTNPPSSPCCVKKEGRRRRGVVEKYSVWAVVQVVMSDIIEGLGGRRIFLLPKRYACGLYHSRIVCRIEF